MQKSHHNFIISVLDTDSITISKPDGNIFTQQEIDKLTEEINSISDDLIKWDFEFYIPKLIVVKSKNYILDYGDGKIKTKGSSIKDAKKEPALLEMMNKMIEAMVNDNHHSLVNIYHNYITEVLKIQDIKRWCSKKTITSAITDCNGYTQADIKSKKLRKNETDVWDAVKHIEGLQEGDKVYLYPTILGTTVIPGGLSEKTGKPLKNKVKEITGLKTYSQWNNDHDVQKLLERVHKTVCIFETILDMNNFVDYSTNKNYLLLEQGKSFDEISTINKTLKK